MEHIGLVGLPNSGKTSLFNALTGSNAQVAMHPFTTTETSIAIAHVPDHRLDALAGMSRSRKVVHAGVEIADIAGLVKGASSGEGLGNRFLAGIREVDALCIVLRAFNDSEIPGESDPVEALSILETELVIADLTSLETQLQRRRKALKSKRQDNITEMEIEVMEEAYSLLSSGTPLYRSATHDPDPSAAARAYRKELFLLTDKPVFCVVNIDEVDIGQAAGGVVTGLGSGTSEGTGKAGGDTARQGKPEDPVARVRDALGGSGDVIGVCVSLEAEAAQLSVGERAEMLEGLGLGEGALAMAARAAYSMLNRWTFFTTGDKESRAWSFRAGSTAPECAGVIHSDLQRGFIRAEVIGWEELLEAGSWQAARQAGHMSLVGKDYQVQDGDVIEIRFNV
ncbi:MAG: YchF family ATPase [Actinobacteria bacterium]|nr:YchF family ATPase [Actinomycetota bacterium]MCL5445965.1 YchF family ATPase [Actinomycetota bacterium]